KQKKSLILNFFLLLVILLSVSPTAVEWSAEMPKSVVGLSGSCVVIPCTFSYPAKGKTYTEFTGIWYKGYYEFIVYHTDTSKISDTFKGRTSLTGDLLQNDCSLKISSLSSSDTGPFLFRIEIKDLDNFSYGQNQTSVTVKETPEIPTVSVEEEMTSGKPVTATCAVSHSCPSDLPRVTWNYDGTHSSLSQPQNPSQLKLTSYTLTFTPSREDHNKHLMVSKPSVKENDSVELTCSSDSNPPANSYQWFSSNGMLLGNKHTHKLERVSRHTRAISCTAINTLGKKSSGPQKINVLCK
uniref:Si:dkey-238d18.5 n=1 Tax=Sinocyclocheilus grahami TaxID=75366 RepID=A0A672LLF6_SINGR